MMTNSIVHHLFEQEKMYDFQVQGGLSNIFLSDKLGLRVLWVCCLKSWKLVFLTVSSLVSNGENISDLTIHGAKLIFLWL